MALPTHLLPTTVVGSYPQPDWLLDRQMLSKIVPRTRMQELWRIPAEFLEQARDDAIETPELVARSSVQKIESTGGWRGDRAAGGFVRTSL